jgi:4-diphosphocytidyl-2-C-methyl-D-erythritol kinase
VLGRRPDGYHILETLFQEIDLRDELILRETAGETSLEVPGHPDLATPENLVIKALRWLENETGGEFFLSMTLNKRIPTAAGLGGGSSNAAAALKGVASLYRLEMGKEDLVRGALALGADVPFFLMGGTAVGEGIGERLTSVDIAMDYELLLVNPGFRVSTAAVFQEYSKTLTGHIRDGRLWSDLRTTRQIGDLLYNDLQPAAVRLHPEILEILNEMNQCGFAHRLMSGSGPTVFGLAESDEIRRMKTGLTREWTNIVACPSNRGIVID